MRIVVVGRGYVGLPLAVGLAEGMESPALDACWSKELDHWEAIIDLDALEPLPIIRAAIRWLRANPPPPAQRVAIVHGDYRSGTVMHDGAGGMRAMFDWEMAHLGDPLEDLGWALDPIWDHFIPGAASGRVMFRSVATVDSRPTITNSVVPIA